MDHVKKHKIQQESVFQQQESMFNLKGEMAALASS
jgi:hypothetical protein